MKRESKKLIEKFLRSGAKAAEGPWFAEDITSDGLTIVDDGRQEGLFSFKLEAFEAEFVVDARAVTEAVKEVLEENKKLSAELAKVKKDCENLRAEIQQIQFDRPHNCWGFPND